MLWIWWTWRRCITSPMQWTRGSFPINICSTSPRLPHFLKSSLYARVGFVGVAPSVNGDINLEGWVSTSSSWVATPDGHRDKLSSGTKRHRYIAYIFRDKMSKPTGCCYFKFINIFLLLNTTLWLFQNKVIQVLFVSIFGGAFVMQTYKNAPINYAIPVCL
jgi:hypothetical protein